MAAREKVDLQVRGVPVALQRRIREKATSKGISVMSLPPVPGYEPGDATKVIREMRDAIDRV